jgi:7-cyano-7-deazaguanine synthase
VNHQQREAIVLLSGGLDSATVLAIARAEGYVCHALVFDYGQRHRHELAAANEVARHLGAHSLTVLPLDLRLFGGSALTADIDVPAHEPRTSIPVTYVPARNLVFLSLAGALAEARGADAILIGVNALDYSGYPDCRPEFIDQFTRTLNLGTKRGVEGSPTRVLTPLIAMTKAEIITLGSRLGVDYSLTHSCYDPAPGGLACHRCDSCVIRERGFEQAGLPDPTRYAS